MQYNINSFTLHQQVDKQTGLTSLVATNKAGNFTITFGPELMATSAFPELLNEGVENATEYIELILNNDQFRSIITQVINDEKAIHLCRTRIQKHDDNEK